MDENNNYQSPVQDPIDDGKGMSIAALVLGIVGIVGGLIPIICYISWICPVLGIIFGVKGRTKSTEVHGKASGLATAGFILGIIGTAFAAIGLICTGIIGAAACAGAGSLY